MSAEWNVDFLLRTRCLSYSATSAKKFVAEASTSAAWPVYMTSLTMDMMALHEHVLSDRTTRHAGEVAAADGALVTDDVLSGGSNVGLLSDVEGAWHEATSPASCPRTSSDAQMYNEPFWTTRTPWSRRTGGMSVVTATQPSGRSAVPTWPFTNFQTAPSGAEIRALFMRSKASLRLPLVDDPAMQMQTPGPSYMLMSRPALETTAMERHPAGTRSNDVKMQDRD